MSFVRLCKGMELLSKQNGVFYLPLNGHLDLCSIGFVCYAYDQSHGD